MTTNHSIVEQWLRRLLPLFLVMVFALTALGAWNNYVSHDNWTMGDWLINYAGGWVRRGLIGEGIVSLAAIATIGPGVLVVLVQLSFYLLYFFFSCLLLLAQRTLVAYVFLLFSPFIFTFQLNSPQGGYRKEIIYFALFALIAWVRRTCRQSVFQRTFVAVMLIYPVAVLSHEMLFVFFPYLLSVYFVNQRLGVRNALLVALLAVPSAVAFAFSLNHPGTADQVASIFNVLGELDYPLKGGAIHYLQLSPDVGRGWVVKMINEGGYILTYTWAIGLALVAFVPVYEELRTVLRNLVVAGLVFVSVAASVVLSTVVIDWGRLIYINLVSLFLLSLLSAPVEQKVREVGRSVTAVRLNGRNYLVVVLFLGWSVLWHIPHCCGQGTFARNASELNVSLLFGSLRQALAWTNQGQ